MSINITILFCWLIHLLSNVMFLFSGDLQGLQRPGGSLPNSVLNSARAATHLSSHQIKKCAGSGSICKVQHSTMSILTLTDGQGPVLKHWVGLGPDTCSHKINCSAPFLSKGKGPREWVGLGRWVAFSQMVGLAVALRRMDVVVDVEMFVWTSPQAKGQTPRGSGWC